jgi:hypothetical protein
MWYVVEGFMPATSISGGLPAVRGVRAKPDGKISRLTGGNRVLSYKRILGGRYAGFAASATNQRQGENQNHSQPKQQSGETFHRHDSWESLAEYIKLKAQGKDLSEGY